jgi:hypothetical protein
VFDVLIPRTDDRTGLVHPSALFDDWTLETAERFGGRHGVNRVNRHG